jgi:hypothetical protein
MAVLPKGETCMGENVKGTEMKVESFFAADEIDAAKRHGAVVQVLKFNKTCLTFPCQAAYDAWINEQRTLHPTRWAHSFSLRRRVPVA